MAFDPRNARKPRVQNEAYKTDRDGRMVFESLEARATYERYVGSLNDKGHYEREVVIPASLGYPEERKFERVHWGRK